MSQGRVGIFLETFSISTAPNCNEAQKYFSSFDEWRTKVRRHRSRFDREYCLYTSSSRQPVRSWAECGPLGLVRTRRAGLTLVTRTAVTTRHSSQVLCPKKGFQPFSHLWLDDQMCQNLRQWETLILTISNFWFYMHLWIMNEVLQTRPIISSLRDAFYLCYTFDCELCLPALLLYPGGVTPDPLLFK